MQATVVIFWLTQHPTCLRLYAFISTFLRSTGSVHFCFPSSGGLCWRFAPRFIDFLLCLLIFRSLRFTMGT
jgi:hypothetical protein